jgi:LysR family transcriptional regulator, glycine cleavage system transcriptional activator
LVRRFYDLPSLTSLAAFEASARHSSFKQAAAELNVTPGAVSRQIKAIEDEIGVALFVRRPRGVTLTPPGEELYRVLASSFSRASETIRSIRRGDKARNVALACTDVFATMWLTPRMPEFWRNAGDITVDLLISDDVKNFRRAEVELRVRYGLGAWIGETAELMFDDCLYPVCSPSFAALHPKATRADLSELPLLNVDWVDPDWMGWEEVLVRGNLQHRSSNSRRFGKFSVALQAAMADQGLVVGWHRMVGPLVEKGELVRFTDLVIPSPGGYYLTWNSNRELTPAAGVLRDWVRKVAQEERKVMCPTA